MSQDRRQRRAGKKGLLWSKVILGVFMLLCVCSGMKQAFAAEEEEVFVPSSIPAPEFSVEGGFYEADFELTLTVPNGTTVYYTLDGSDPVIGEEETFVYTAPISILARKVTKGSGQLLKATVVRAVSVDENGEYGDIQTNTYFVAKDMKNWYKVPVISLVTDPENLYDEETGIFVNPLESGREWERIGHFEYFLSDGTNELSLNVGMRIHGGYTRNMNIKSFRVYARAEYDTVKNFKFDFFSDSIIPAMEKNGNEKVIEKFKRLVLRTGGNEGDAWEATYFRDILAQSLVTDTLLDLQAYQPTVTYINGEFYGILNIRERQDDRYLSSHYNSAEDQFAILGFEYEKDEEGKVIIPTDGDKVFDIVSEEGPEDAIQYFREAYQYVLTQDLSDDAVFAKAAEYFDIDNFIDYLCVELYSGNTDWPHNNCKAWFYIGEPSDEYGLDGKIRFFVFDLDFGFGLYGHRVDENTLAPMVSDTGSAEPYRDVLTCLFRAFLQNEGFRQKFSVRFFDLLNTNFASYNVIETIDALEQVYTPLVVEQYSKYGQKFPYESNVNTAREFAKMRANAMRLFLAKDLELGGRIDVTLKTEEELHGSININTVTLTSDDFNAEGKWSGKILADAPLTIEAVPEAGYVFAGWEGSVTGGEAELTFAAGENKKNLTLTPVFVSAEEITEETPSTEKEETPTGEQNQNPSTGEETTQSGETVKQEKEVPEEKDFPIGWVIAAVLVLAGGVTLFVVKKKKK